MSIDTSFPLCSDPLVVPSPKAPKKIQDLWTLHGHPHSERYSDPKLVSLAALIRHDGVVYNGQKAILYPVNSEANSPYGCMTWDEFDDVTETLALLYARQLEKDLELGNATQKQPTIGLLGKGRTLEYFCTQLALQKLGVRVLLLAESNATVALHYLLETCDASAVIVDSENAGVDTNGIRKITLIEQLPHTQKTEQVEVDALKFQDFGDVWERHTFIIHSSGSTGMPKPIVHTNRSMMLIARMYRLFQEFEVVNWFLLFPLYHIAGVSIAFSGLPNGQVLSFPPLQGPMATSAIFQSWKTLASLGYPVDCIHCPPTLIENFYEHILDSDGDFSPLTSMKVLQPGGAALPEKMIKILTDKGVNIKSTYGTTEIGPPLRTIPHSRDNPHCYRFRNLYPDNPLVHMEKVGEGLYECVIYKGFQLAANIFDDLPEGQPYRTNDLFREDPPHSGYYILQGRKDDILVHSNGENTSAGPLQIDIQTSSKSIHKVVALGHSRPCVSLLVELGELYDPVDQATREEVFKVVEEVNKKFPSHSRVMSSMIYFLPKGSTLPITPKGNVRRKEAEKIYESEIAALYENLEGSTSDLPSLVSDEGLTEYVRSLFVSLANVPSEAVKDWTSLHELGINSRLALCLRSSLSRFLGQKISLNTIFENPTVSKLVAALTVKSKQQEPTKISQSEIIDRMISRLEAEFLNWPSQEQTAYSPRQKEIVLLTGASGSLGTSLIQSLSSKEDVSHVYALIRGPNQTSKLSSALQRRGIDPSIVDSQGKVTALNFCMQDPLLGLDIESYYKLATSVTVVMHNAWKLNFNQTVEDFENDCIRSTMNLLRFCCTGIRKKFVFTSSISACMGRGAPPSIPETPIGPDPTIALSTGYAQSKYIIERLTQKASSVLNIPVTILRVGQLCGSTATGQWNSDEMWPILFASSVHPAINALPALKMKIVDWVPVNAAARVISDVVFQQAEEVDLGKDIYNVHNIANPNPLPWSDLLDILNKSNLSSSSPQNHPLPVIPLSEWLQRHNNTTSELEIPALRLLPSFEGLLQDEEDGEQDRMFETSKTEKISAALTETGPVCHEWVEKWIGRWKEERFSIIKSYSEVVNLEDFTNAYFKLENFGDAAVWKHVCKNLMQGPWKEKVQRKCVYGKDMQRSKTCVVYGFEDWIDLARKLRQLGPEKVQVLQLHSTYRTLQPALRIEAPATLEGEENDEGREHEEFSETDAPQPKRRRIDTGSVPDAQAHTLSNTAMSDHIPHHMPAPHFPSTSLPDSGLSLVQLPTQRPVTQILENSDTETLIESFKSYLKQKTLKGNWQNIEEALDIMIRHKLEPSQLDDLTMDQLGFIHMPLGSYLKIKAEVWKWKIAYRQQYSATLSRMSK
ncbi:hypothetical protein B7463_g2658, partial [Scytalidium lignicola]